MSIAQQITVRYRAEGHVRFAVPKEFSDPQVALQLQQRLSQAEGIYRVDLYRSQGKLSVRYIEGVTDFKSVARALFAIVTGIDLNPAPACCASGGGLVQQEAEPGVGGWVKAKYQEVKETFMALGIVARAAGRHQSTALTPEREKFVMDFLTDILVLYLIKLHWHMILTEWMRRPWAYRYEWMATFYMVFLLVRSKRPKNP
ncbi:MAG: hypothetical protein ACKN9T_05015 [Candidatus Methylumidiphilus sp.]